MSVRGDSLGNKVGEVLQDDDNLRKIRRGFDLGEERADDEEREEDEVAEKAES